MPDGDLFRPVVGPHGVNYEAARFDGDAGIEDLADHERLARQLDKVEHVMIDGRWRTLSELSKLIDAPTPSISARLRDLRKPRFGGYDVQRRQRTMAAKGTYEYRVVGG